MTDSTVTFGQLRACLNAARDVLDRAITDGELEDYLPACAHNESTEFTLEMLDLTRILVRFGRAK
ncbi:hypothetical protein [Mesorhizobium sp. WSM3876]|uniref:hypothetical protein n=1 Tax=Mesorhizobium sp. WSM3876 TaxID=422277 RepID=UPI000BB0A465|nr:hypothetical protein [Mesorhizobium sp. WSM3876]PBB85720.1 hypothetical protein CK216_16465 [Mesorhizobium sp. WSM3876]